VSGSPVRKLVHSVEHEIGEYIGELLGTAIADFIARILDLIMHAGGEDSRSAGGVDSTGRLATPRLTPGDPSYEIIHDPQIEEFA
jgi:hypothetical protein